MKQSKSWQPLSMEGLISRLSEAKSLVERAAALVAAKDAERVRNLAELQRQNHEENASGTGARRRYR